LVIYKYQSPNGLAAGQCNAMPKDYYFSFSKVHKQKKVFRRPRGKEVIRAKGVEHDTAPDSVCEGQRNKEEHKERE
jgi:hypothetical protein